MPAKINVAVASAKLLLAAGISLVGTGCTALERINHAIVEDNVISAPFNIPPILNETPYELVAIDGNGVSRESPYAHLIADLQPAALVRPGPHVFKVAFFPGRSHLPNEIKSEATFTRTVESGKTYIIYSKEGQPALIEAQTNPHPLTVKPSIRLAAEKRPPDGDPIAGIISEIEKQEGGRIGFAAFSVGTGKSLSYRADEAFATCSTYKALLAAAVLKRVDAGENKLTRPISYGPADLLSYAPVTKAHVAEGSLKVGELCAAAVEQSDNTAANLLLATVGGPAGLTGFFRSMGDSATRIDRNEPSMNSADPGDPRDTTTPNAFAHDLNALLFGSILSDASKQTLGAWLKACTTGAARIRAGVPAGWTVGDKTGSGGHNSTNDTAVLWPPGRPPIIICVFFVGSDRPAAERDAVIAKIALLAVHSLQGVGPAP